MPSKYSHSLVIADYSTRGLIRLPEEQHERYVSASAGYSGRRSVSDARLRGTQSAQGYSYRSPSAASSATPIMFPARVPSSQSLTADMRNYDGTTDTIKRQSKRASQLYSLSGQSEPQLYAVPDSSRDLLEMPVPQMPPGVSKSNQSRDSAYERQNRRNLGPESRAPQHMEPEQKFGSAKGFHNPLTQPLLNGTTPASSNAEQGSPNVLKRDIKGTTMPVDSLPKTALSLKSGASSQERSPAGTTPKNDLRLKQPALSMHGTSDRTQTSPSEGDKSESVLTKVSRYGLRASLPVSDHPNALKNSSIQSHGSGRNLSGQTQLDAQRASLPQSRAEPISVSESFPTNSFPSQTITEAPNTTRASRKTRSNSSISTTMTNMPDSPPASTKKQFSPLRATYSPLEPAWRLPEIQEDHDFAHSMFEDDFVSGVRDQKLLTTIPESDTMGQISSGRDVSFVNDDSASEMSAALPPPISRFRDEEAEFQANMAKFFGGGPVSDIPDNPSQNKTANTKKAKGFFSRFRPRV